MSVPDPEVLDADVGQVRPLVSIATEARMTAIGFLIGSLPFGIVAVLTQRPGRALAFIGLLGLFFGVGMYLFFLLFWRRGPKKAVAPPTAERESREVTRRRVFLKTGGILVWFAVLAVLQGDPRGVSGVCLGGGLLLLLVTLRVRRWEEKNSVRMLREPRVTWSRSAPLFVDYSSTQAT